MQRGCVQALNTGGFSRDSSDDFAVCFLVSNDYHLVPSDVP